MSDTWTGNIPMQANGHDVAFPIFNLTLHDGSTVQQAPLLANEPWNGVATEAQYKAALAAEEWLWNIVAADTPVTLQAQAAVLAANKALADATAQYQAAVKAAQAAYAPIALTYNEDHSVLAQYIPFTDKVRAGWLSTLSTVPIGSVDV